MIRNLFTLVSGSALAQAIPLLVSPLLTRIYTPEQFGLFATYMAIVSIFVPLATGRYEYAILLPAKDRLASNIVWLVITIALITSVIVAVLLLLFYESIPNGFTLGVGVWLIAILPITLFFSGIGQSLRFWSLRTKDFKRLSLGGVVKSGTTSVSNVGMGSVGFGWEGLVVGNIVGLVVYVGMLYKGSVAAINLKLIAKLLKKYWRFPVFDAPSALSYSLYSNAAIIFIQRNFDGAVAGYYFFANRLLRLPFMFVVAAFSDVFFQHLAQNVAKDNISTEVQKFSLRIFLFSFLPFFIIVFLSKWYSGVIFGEGWSELYKYIYILSMPIFATIVFSPYGHVLKIIGRQELSLIVHLIKSIGIAFLFVSYLWVEYQFLYFVYIYALVDAALQIFSALMVDKAMMSRSKIVICWARYVVLLLIAVLIYFLIIEGE